MTTKQITELERQIRRTFPARIKDAVRMLPDSNPGLILSYWESNLERANRLRSEAAELEDSAIQDIVSRISKNWTWSEWVKAIHYIP